jgi:predicted GNAT family N-acyltransferase
MSSSGRVGIVEIVGPEEVHGKDAIDEIGRLRYEVWKGDGLLDLSLFPDGTWVDDMDFGIRARHWVIRQAKTGELVAAARLTRHESLDDDYRDVKLWRDSGLTPEVPLIDFGRLCVRSDFRLRGLAKSLDVIRLAAAHAWDIGGKKPRVCVCTASASKVESLKKLGFFSIDKTAIFKDRPTTVFYALQYNIATSI